LVANTERETVVKVSVGLPALSLGNAGLRGYVGGAQFGFAGSDFSSQEESPSIQGFGSEVSVCTDTVAMGPSEVTTQTFMVRMVTAEGSVNEESGGSPSSFPAEESETGEGSCRRHPPVGVKEPSLSFFLAPPTDPGYQERVEQFFRELERSPDPTPQLTPILESGVEPRRGSGEFLGKVGGESVFSARPPADPGMWDVLEFTGEKGTIPWEAWTPIMGQSYVYVLSPSAAQRQWAMGMYDVSGKLWTMWTLWIWYMSCGAVPEEQPCCCRKAPGKSTRANEVQALLRPAVRGQQ
jgi:hypothetical protein